MGINKRIYIFGGGTFSYVRSHLALCTPAFGTTAKKIADACETLQSVPAPLDIKMILTKMADPNSNIITNDDVKASVEKVIEDPLTKIIFFNTAMCDFGGEIDGISSGKYAPRLSSQAASLKISLHPLEKVVSMIRKKRKDIFLVSFKTTVDASEQDMYLAGLNLLKTSSSNLVLVNDLKTRTNMVITPEEARYHVTQRRDDAIMGLVEMALLRSHLTFTRSTIVAGTPVRWDSNEIPSALKTVVDYCISGGAYKPFNGATVGHFAAKISDTEFLTSIRKTNFNDLSKNGLVRIKTDGPDSVLAYGAKPSVGGQSQRIVFHDHQDYDCIVHFHCPMKKDHRDAIPVVSQREYECGSHECGRNTSNNLKQFGNLSCVFLDQHGPNIVFNRKIDPKEVIDFINANFDLYDKTGGLVE